MIWQLKSYSPQAKLSYFAFSSDPAEKNHLEDMQAPVSFPHPTKWQAAEAANH